MGALLAQIVSKCAVCGHDIRLSQPTKRVLVKALLVPAHRVCPAPASEEPEHP